ncbi:MAG: FkbM family methyltransferase [Verrucomicrobiales bacterium]
MKRLIQDLLRRSGLYHRVKASRAYEVYWSFADKRLVDARKMEIAFYRTLLSELPQGGLIFDVGANQGHKTSVFLELGSRVIAVDPDPHNQEILKQSFRRLRLVHKPVTIIGKAVSDTIGEAIFWVDEPGSAKNTLSEKWVDALREDKDRFGAPLGFQNKRTVATTTLDALIAEHGQPHFIKIDVEGHEPGVIRGLTQPVPCLSFEVNLPDFLAEGIDCIRLLKGIRSDGEFNFVADSRCDEGLVLEKWCDCETLEAILNTCKEPSIEIFWRNPVNA